MIKVFDSHCHPQFPQYDADRESVLRHASDAGVGMICVGTDLEMSGKAIELAARHEEVWASVGLHPNDNLGEKYDQELYEKLAGHPKVVAIGEVGLDYYRTTDDEKKKFQRERFEQQIELAVKLRKPLIIHCRSAHADMIEVLSRYQLSAKSYKLTGVIHSFTGTYADAKTYVELGFHIGLNGIVTFPPSHKASEGHGALLEAVREIPLERILLETDAPYLTPEPYRGKSSSVKTSDGRARNEPAYVTYVAEHVARLRGLPVEKVMEQTTQNARELFGMA